MDLRKPRLDKLLEPFLPEGSQRKVISNVLIGDCKLADVIIPVKQFDMDVVLAGPVPPNPSELLSSGCLKEILEEAQQQYDLVIIDTAPILAVSDTLIIASHHVPLLLTTRLFHVTRPVLRSLRDRLAQVNISLAGLIANNVDAPKNAYSYTLRQLWIRIWIRIRHQQNIEKEKIKKSTGDVRPVRPRIRVPSHPSKHQPL